MSDKIDKEDMVMYLTEQMQSIKSMKEEDDVKEVMMIDAAQIRMLRMIKAWVEEY